MNGRSVLIVEDEPLTRLLCIDVLNEAGFKAIAVANGDEALIFLERTVTNAIISDIRMPGPVDGLALRREVERHWPEVKMLLTSGEVQVEQSELAHGQVLYPSPMSP